MFNRSPCSLTVFDDGMCMRMRFFDVQHESVPMFQPERFAQEVVRRRQTALGGVPAGIDSMIL